MRGITDHPDDFDREWAYRRGYAHGALAHERERRIIALAAKLEISGPCGERSGSGGDGKTQVARPRAPLTGARAGVRCRWTFICCCSDLNDRPARYTVSLHSAVRVQAIELSQKGDAEEARVSPPRPNQL
jgi:hypothetical protein